MDFYIWTTASRKKAFYTLSSMGPSIEPEKPWNNTPLGHLGPPLPPCKASIGDHIPAIQREERIREREGEIIAVSVEL